MNKHTVIRVITVNMKKKTHTHTYNCNHLNFQIYSNIQVDIRGSCGLGFQLGIRSKTMTFFTNDYNL